MRRLSSLLLYAGVGICALGVAGLVGGMWLNLPPEVVRRIAMALPFVVGGALLIVGALVGRAARRPEVPVRPDLSPADADVHHLGAGTHRASTPSGRAKSTVHAIEPRDRAT